MDKEDENKDDEVTVIPLNVNELEFAEYIDEEVKSIKFNLNAIKEEDLKMLEKGFFI